MMALSNEDLRAISKSLGRSASSTAEKIERVTGQRYNDAVAEFTHLNDLLARIAVEQVKRLNKTA